MEKLKFIAVALLLAGGLSAAEVPTSGAVEPPSYRRAHGGSRPRSRSKRKRSPTFLTRSTMGKPEAPVARNEKAKKKS